MRKGNELTEAGTDGTTFWVDYVSRWTGWNRVRTGVALGAQRRSRLRSAYYAAEERLIALKKAEDYDEDSSR
jgi:hypothetical protein